MHKFPISLSHVQNKDHQKQTAVLQSEIIVSDLIQSTVGAHFHHMPFSGACPIICCMGQKGRAQLLLHWGLGEGCSLISAVYGKEDNVLKIYLYLQEFSACSRKEEITLRSWQLDCGKNSSNDALSMEALPAFAVIECSDLLKPHSIK